MFYKKLFFKKSVLLFTGIIALTFIFTTQPIPKPTPKVAQNTLSALLEDFKKYKTTNHSFHSGDLYEHATWTSYAVNYFANHHKFWCDDLNQEDIKIAFISALLHDIGKAGDLQESYKQKHSHPEDGFQYLIHKKPYKIDKNTSFDFKQMFAAFNIDESTQKKIAILVGSHYKFGDYMQKKISKKEFMDTILRCAKQAGYDTKKIDSKLIKQAILVSAADVRGSQLVKPAKKHEFFAGTQLGLVAALVKMPKTHGKAPKVINYDKFDFDTKGKECRKKLLTYFPEWLAHSRSGIFNQVSSYFHNASKTIQYYFTSFKKRLLNHAHN